MCTTCISSFFTLLGPQALPMGLAGQGRDMAGQRPGCRVEPGLGQDLVRVTRSTTARWPWCRAWWWYRAKVKLRRHVRVRPGDGDQDQPWPHDGRAGQACNGQAEARLGHQPGGEGSGHAQLGHIWGCSWGRAQWESFCLKASSRGRRGCPCWCLWLSSWQLSPRPLALLFQCWPWATGVGTHSGRFYPCSFKHRPCARVQTNVCIFKWQSTVKIKITIFIIVIII